MITLQHKDLLNAGVHFGHLTRKWHPNMAPFIFMESNGIHIIDLNKTLLQLREAAYTLKSIASTGKRILFVATKKQVKGVIEQEAMRLGMPYVTERWLGGTLTNFATIRRLLKKMFSFDKLVKSTAYANMAKKEQLMIVREKTKLERLLKGLADTTRLPAALFVVDIKKEHIAVKEAKKLGLPVFALTDTNTDPMLVDYPIPSNDDTARSVELITKVIGSAIEEGLEERNKQREVDTTGKEARAKNVEKVVVPSEATEKESLKVESVTKPATKSTENAAPQEKAPVSRQKVSVKSVQAPTKATATPEKPKTNAKSAVKKVTSKQGTA